MSESVFRRKDRVTTRALKRDVYGEDKKFPPSLSKRLDLNIPNFRNGVKYVKEHLLGRTPLSRLDHKAATAATLEPNP
ncbi:uncharacterized [Tachysurus ichikawai]